MFIPYDHQLDLVNRGLAVMKVKGDLSLFKYHRKVMFDYLWNENLDFLECRGHVYNNKTGEIVQAAPRKSFNYLENDWWKDVPLDTVVQIDKKYNGYLACATMYEGELLVTTTGSFGGEYQEIAKKMIEGTPHIVSTLSHEYTDMFEICAEFDPHIVHEHVGVYPLGFRNKKCGTYFPASTEDSLICDLGHALEIVKTCRHEGYMMYNLYSDPMRIAPAKLKSPYYVGKKKLMRMSQANVKAMYNDPTKTALTLPAIWMLAPHYITSFIKMEEWQVLTDIQRRVFLEKIGV